MTQDPTFPLDERKIEQEVSQFRVKDKASQLLEIKRKLMQSLGRVNDLYKNLGIDSHQVKFKILGILREIQTVPEDSNEAKIVFKRLSKSLNHLIQFIPEDVNTQKHSLHKPEAEATHDRRPIQAPYYPEPIAQWKPPAAQPEYRPPTADWGGSYKPSAEGSGSHYPPVYPEPEGNLDFLSNSVLGLIKTAKLLILSIL